MSYKIAKSFEDVVAEIQEGEIEFVRAELADLNGVSKGFTLDAEYFTNIGRKGMPISPAIICKEIEGRLPSGLDVIEKMGGGNTLSTFDFSTFKILPFVDSTAPAS